MTIRAIVAGTGPASELTMKDDHETLVAVATEIRASDFKATCLALLDEVAAHRVEYVITKRGRPIARLIPLDESVSVHGSVTVLADDEALLMSVGEVWTAEE